MRTLLFIIVVLLISNCISWAQIRDAHKGEYAACYGNLHPEGVPEFPGGNSSRARFISDNLNYPPSALREKIQGTVTIGFTVEEDGTLTEFRILKGVYYSIDAEALRIAESMPSWIPGKYSGVAVRAQHTIDIRFKLPIQE